MLHALFTCQIEFVGNVEDTPMPTLLKIECCGKTVRGYKK
jgi:hypothetical protein